MTPKIIVACPSANVIELAKGMAPAGFETIVAQAGDPMIEEHLGDASYFACYPNVDLGPAFHAKAPKLKRRPPLTTFATRLMAMVFSLSGVPRKRAPCSL